MYSTTILRLEFLACYDNQWAGKKQRKLSLISLHQHNEHSFCIPRMACAILDLFLYPTMQTNETKNANTCNNKFHPNNNKCHNECKQMPQQMQTNATTNANKCKTLRQKMHQTHVRLNAAIYVIYLFFLGVRL